MKKSIKNMVSLGMTLATCTVLGLSGCTEGDNN